MRVLCPYVSNYGGKYQLYFFFLNNTSHWQIRSEEWSEAITTNTYLIFLLDFKLFEDELSFSWFLYVLWHREKWHLDGMCYLLKVKF